MFVGFPLDIRRVYVNSMKTRLKVNSLSCRRSIKRRWNNTDTTMWRTICRCCIQGFFFSLSWSSILYWIYNGGTVVEQCWKKQVDCHQFTMTFTKILISILFYALHSALCSGYVHAYWGIDFRSSNYVPVKVADLRSWMFWSVQAYYSSCFFMQLRLAEAQRESERSQAVKISSQTTSLVEYLRQREQSLLNSIKEIKRNYGKWQFIACSDYVLINSTIFSFLLWRFWNFRRAKCKHGVFTGRAAFHYSAFEETVRKFARWFPTVFDLRQVGSSIFNSEIDVCVSH